MHASLSAKVDVFREAEASDIPFLLQGFRETHGGLAHAQESDFIERLNSDIFCNHPKAFARILEQGTEQAAFILGSTCYFASTGQVLWISQAYISPKFRGKTAARFLYHIKSYARELGAKRLFWCSDSKMGRLPGFWNRKGAKALNENYTFWAMDATQ